MCSEITPPYMHLVVASGGFGVALDTLCRFGAFIEHAQSDVALAVTVADYPFVCSREKVTKCYAVSLLVPSKSLSK